jgi:hypothetical protein
MLIINKYKATAPNPVVATGNNVEATGITGSRWLGTNPDFGTGATGNPTAGQGLVYVDTLMTYDGQLVSKFVQILIPAALTANVASHIKVTKDSLGITGNKSIVGATYAGIYDPNANETNAPTPSLIEIVSETTGQWNISRDALIFYVPDGHQVLYQNKYVNFVIYYTNN